MNDKRPAENTTTLVVEDKNLIRLTARPAFYQYLRQLWDRRHYIVQSAYATSFNDSRDLRLGRLWTIINPILEGSAYALLFGLILRTSRGIENFTGYVLLGISLVSIIQLYISQGNTLIRANRGMLQSFHFPRASIVLSTSLRNAINSLPAVTVTAILGIAFGQFEHISWTLIFVPYYYLILIIFGTGLLFFTGRICALVPEMRALFNLIVRLIFFASAVFFNPEAMPINERFSFLFTWNPTYLFLKVIRDATLYGVAPSFFNTAYLSLVSAAAFIFGLLFFWEAEEKYVETL